eukprot:scaffold245090_cov18-Tisochrysis_lutea.AAC.1
MDRDRRQGHGNLKRQRQTLVNFPICQMSLWCQKGRHSMHSECAYDMNKGDSSAGSCMKACSCRTRVS